MNQKLYTVGSCNNVKHCLHSAFTLQEESTVTMNLGVSCILIRDQKSKSRLQEIKLLQGPT